MINPSPALKEKIIINLTTDPDSLNMLHYGTLARGAPTRSTKKRRLRATFCLVGHILVAAGIAMEYEDGIAVRLGAREKPPTAQWVAYEVSISEVAVDPRAVALPAKARECWADRYGDEAARRLPFYGPDWELEPHQLNQVTPGRVIEALQVINALFAGAPRVLAA